MSSKSHMLEYCLSVMLGAGGEDGASVLEDGLLEKYIRLAGYMPEEAVYIPDDSLRQDGKLLFESFVLMDSETYMFHKAEWGEDVAFVGYPGGAGNGMMLYADNCYAVSAQSRHKDGAWKFVESFFTREWQEKITPNYAFSVDRDRFEQQLKHAEQVQWYTDRDGRQREAPVLTYDMNGEVVEVFAPRPEDTDSLRQMVEGARMIKRGDVEALRIVQEEAAYYFAGQKSLEEVADIIRNRMGLMAEERK
jgi:ABC-type glycerol-3-phosphate transport system substrate-binding protein